MLVFYYTSVCWMLAFYSNYHEVKTMRSPRVPAEEQYRLIMECRKSGLSDQEVVKIEMNSLSASNAIDKSTDASVMELVIGNTGLRIPNGTDPVIKEGS